jgi:hypothetical protein
MAIISQYGNIQKVSCAHVDIVEHLFNAIGKAFYHHRKH